MTRLWLAWAARIPAVLIVLLASRLLAPVAVLCQRDPAKLPGWAWWVGPFDHDLCGPNADPMWIRWWETDDGGGRAWYVDPLKRAGIRDCAHPIVRLLQLWRNGGAGAMYRLLGTRTDNLLVTRQEEPGRTEYLAYRLPETMGVGGGRVPMPGARPVSFYLSLERPMLGRVMTLQIGTGKLNHPINRGGRTYAKWCCSPRLRS